MHKKLVFPLWFVLPDEPGTPVSGNPISYFNGTRWNFTWQNGKQLASASTTSGDTDIDIAYTYDLNSLRTSKTVTYTTTEESGDQEHTHSYTSTVTAPTCLNAGYTTYACACGDSYTDNIVSALGHNYVESETETGSVFTCSRCGDSYTGHQHTYTESVVAPSCIMRGYTVYTCSCGDTYMGNYVPALGHDGVEVGRTQTMITYLCNRCGATYQEPIVVDPNPPVEMSLRRSTVSVETEHHEYVYASGQLLREVITTTDAEGNVTTETLDFTYDASDYPYALTYTNGTTSTTYYYIVNLQGDVLYLVDENETAVATYTYDDWGKVLSAVGNMAQVNPLRYRGYCYDNDTHFYYLQSRFYDPEIRRFVNADGYASTGQGFLGQNMFAYCRNNPICHLDIDGYEDEEASTKEYEGPRETYATPEEAVAAFAGHFYYATAAYGIEIHAYIVEVYVDGETRYMWMFSSYGRGSYDRFGNKRNEVQPNFYYHKTEDGTHSGYRIVGDVHTHPPYPDDPTTEFDESLFAEPFSKCDFDLIEDNMRHASNLNAEYTSYLVTPTGIRRYDGSSALGTWVSGYTLTKTDWKLSDFFPPRPRVVQNQYYCIM